MVMKVGDNDSGGSVVVCLPLVIWSFRRCSSKRSVMVEMVVMMVVMVIVVKVVSILSSSSKRLLVTMVGDGDGDGDCILFACPSCG